MSQRFVGPAGLRKKIRADVSNDQLFVKVKFKMAAVLPFQRSMFYFSFLSNCYVKFSE